MAIRTAADYLAQLVALLPPGPAWDLEMNPELAGPLHAAAELLASEDARAADLLSEADPLTVRELVPDWERVMGLPDPCMGDSPKFEDRQLAVRRRLTETGGATPAYFVDIAIALGYPEARVIEHRAPRFGRSRFGSARFGTWSAQFMWTLETGPRRRVGRRFGVSYWGERFGSSASAALECAIQRSAPAHTVEFIKYGENT
ncbi:putative phage tail protein [Pseudomonas sp. 148P]|uniref:Phage tail protein n=1 Tax=Pseudomonas ulcerans TaxID=3115852 RepID=A0ABU7HWE6_9PSED|nr:MULTISPECIES: putative phage tail protein [unclassified Pseudomonas]MEE1922911.1 putative phage tail protein [Pseudomonas sp. 147P]MEE1935761.1 putative phage tail protein [Pseudomonas sp. 148P]